MIRIRAVWTGGPLGTGLSVFNLGGTTVTSTSVTDSLTAIRAFFNSCFALVPPAYSLTVNSTADIIDETTGVLTGAVSGTPPAVVTGSAGTPSHSAGVGIRARWQTSDYVRGRRCVGTTFIVPIVGNAMESNGTIQSVNISSVQTAGTTLITALSAAGHGMGVWTRPTAPGAADGDWHSVTSCTVPDQAAWLTTRRS